MGRSITPTFRVEYHDNPFARVRFSAHNSMAWNSKSYGRPTATNLEEWRNKMHESFAAGGCNDHVSKARGYTIVISHARIVRQQTGEVVAEFSAPTFEAV